MPDKDKPVADAPADEPKAADKPADSGGDQGGQDQYGRQLHEITCSSCGNKAQVPFKPSGDRPVYCRDCYMQQRRDRRGPRR